MRSISLLWFARALAAVACLTLRLGASRRVPTHIHTCECRYR